MCRITGALISAARRWCSGRRKSRYAAGLHRSRVAWSARRYNRRPRQSGLGRIAALPARGGRESAGLRSPLPMAIGDGGLSGLGSSQKSRHAQQWLRQIEPDAKVRIFGVTPSWKRRCRNRALSQSAQLKLPIPCTRCFLPRNLSKGSQFVAPFRRNCLLPLKKIRPRISHLTACWGEVPPHQPPVWRGAEKECCAIVAESLVVSTRKTRADCSSAPSAADQAQP